MQPPFLAILAFVHASIITRHKEHFISLKSWTEIGSDLSSLRNPIFLLPINIINETYRDSLSAILTVPSGVPSNAVPLAHSYLTVTENSTIAATYGPHFIPLVFLPSY